MNAVIIGPIYPYRGGIANYTRQLAMGFLEAGHRCRVVSFARQYPRFLYPGRTDIDPSPRPANLPEIELALDPFLPWTWQRVARELRQMRPDLVCINWWTPFWAVPLGFLIRACEGAGLPTVVIAHNVFAHEEFPLSRLISRLILRQGTRFLLHSAREEAKLRQLLRNKAEIVLRPLPPFSHATPSSGYNLREALGLSPDDKLLLFFGLIRPYKGLSVLIEALGILGTKNIRPKLVIAGEFWEPVRPYRDEIARQGLESQVFILEGYVPDDRIGALFERSDILVAPYLRGTQSGSVALAQSYGLPIVASASIASGIETMEGYPLSIFETGNARDLARAIESSLGAVRVAAPMPAHLFWADLARALAALA